MKFLKRIGAASLSILLLGGTTPSFAGASEEQQQHRIFTIEIIVEDAEGAAAVVRDLAGYNLMASTTFHETGSSANFHRRVDIADYGYVQDVLRSLGDIRHENEHTTHMAAEITDLQARLRANTDEIARLTTLMANSANLEVLVYVESRLSQAEWQRDFLMGRLNQVNNLTTHPYLSITLWENPPEIQPLSLTFGERISYQFTGSITVLGVFVGDFLVLLASVAIPFAIIAALAGLGWVISIRIRKKIKLSKGKTITTVKDKGESA